MAATPKSPSAPTAQAISRAGSPAANSTIPPMATIRAAVSRSGSPMTSTAIRHSSGSAGMSSACRSPALPLLCLMAVLVMGAPDLGTAALIVAIAFTPFRRARLAAWFDPMAYADTYGYQTVQGFIALGSGGLLGVGLGQSRGKWLYVPNAHTDFIYAIIGEELGLAGAMFVLLLFALLAVGGFRTARLAPASPSSSPMMA